MMRRKYKVALVSTILILTGVAGLLLLADKQRLLTIFSGRPDLFNPDRVRVISPSKVVRLMAPQPGNTVLDLGAGDGLFTFMLAEAVGPSGKVFATDTDHRSVGFLADKARKDNVNNVEPIRVRADGLDSFYGQHVFDIILVADVVPLIPEPEAFFEQLRMSLREGSGRLWVVDMRLDPDFSILEFDDVINLFKIPENEVLQSIILKRLGGGSRQALSDHSASGVPGYLQACIVEDLNRMLEDPTLWTDVQAQKLRLNSREEEVREYLCEVLERERADAKPGNAVTPRAKAVQRFLNRLIIQELLGTYWWESAFELDKIRWRRWKPLLARLCAGQDYEKLFAKSGYELVHEHNILIYHRIWEFKRSR